MKSVDIVMRSYNEAWALKETLAALSVQKSIPWKLHVIDSGSTDGSIEMLESFRPANLVKIRPDQYIPGFVLNMGMKLSTSPFVVFLNADATPVNEYWLEKLLSVSLNPRVAAAFGRQIPRPHCLGPFRRDYDMCFGPDRKSDQLAHFFSMVSSVVNRQCWEARPFREDLDYAEDHDFSLYWKMSGYDIAYIDDSIVLHSHNYSAGQAFKRAQGDAFAIAKGGLDRRSPGTMSHLLAGCVKDWINDLIYCSACRCPLDGLRSLPVRVGQRMGYWLGYKKYVSQAAGSIQNPAQFDCGALHEKIYGK